MLSACGFASLICSYLLNSDTDSRMQFSPMLMKRIFPGTPDRSSKNSLTEAPAGGRIFDLLLVPTGTTDLWKGAGDEVESLPWAVGARIEALETRWAMVRSQEQLE